MWIWQKNENSIQKVTNKSSMKMMNKNQKIKVTRNILYLQILPFLLSTWTIVWTNVKPVPHICDFESSHRKWTSLSNTVTWYCILLKNVIFPPEFDEAFSADSCRITCAHFASFSLLKHQFIYLWGKKI